MPTPSRPEFEERESEPQLGLFSEPARSQQAEEPSATYQGEQKADALIDAATSSASFRPVLEPPSAGDGSKMKPQGGKISPLAGDPEARARKRVRPRADSSLPSWAYAHAKPHKAAALSNADASPRQAIRSSTAEAAETDLFEEDAERAVPESRRVWTVADLVSQVRTHVEQTWADLWVHGEISNLRTAPSGHLYFTLKDGESQLPAVLFRRQAQLLRFRPEDGLEVLLRGKVSVYEQRGQMQLIAEYLEPVGAGSLQIAFEQLKARLSAEGLFSADRKRALPPYPRCVGIVTSPSGAVIRDFLNVANRRHAALDVLLYPAVVQGSLAASEVAAGIAWFNATRSVEVIVIARGGGSLEDLAPFNTEVLARAIAASALPVVSAIGHETDFTIADFVADLRAPTPSAAAELITGAQHRIEEQVAELRQRLGRACRYQLMLARQRLGALPVSAMQGRLSEGLNRREQRVDTLRFRLEAALRAQMHEASARVAQHSVAAALARLQAGMGERARSVEGLHFRLQHAYAQRLRRAREQLQSTTAALLRHDAVQRLATLRNQWTTLDARLVRAGMDQSRAQTNHLHSLARQLEHLSPLAVLGRGYALVFDAEGALVKRAVDVGAGELLTLRLAEGTVRSRAEQE